MLNPAKRSSAKQDENEPARSIQRRCPGHYHHDHGAGIESAARGRIGGIKADAPCFVELCPKLHLSRHLLEQSPSSLPSCQRSQRRHSIGTPVPALLAVAL